MTDDELALEALLSVMYDGAEAADVRAEAGMLWLALAEIGAPDHAHHKANVAELVFGWRGWNGTEAPTIAPPEGWAA